jgi:serine protease AprX
LGVVCSEVTGLKKSYYQKIDPEVRNAVKVSSDEPFRVILYANEYDKCKPTLDNLGVKVTAEIPLIEGYVVDLPAQMLSKLAGMKRIRYIAADMDIKAQMDIASRVVKADEFHKAGITGNGIGIAILDTGIYPHPDFTMPRRRIAAFLDIVNGRTMPYDDNGHGTFVSGVAAGSGYASSGMYKGIAPDASLISVKVMDSQGNGKSSDVLSALQWVADNSAKYNIKVTSLSLGAAASDFTRDDAMIKAAEMLWKRGITVVVAAGNDGPAPKTITVPGTSATLLTVGSMDDKRTVQLSDDVIPDFSSRGPVMNRVKPDVVAPGVNIVSANADRNYQSGTKVTKMTKYYTVMSGTSVSTPLVAGMAALLCQQHPDWNPNRIKQEIMSTANRVTGVAFNEGNGAARMYLNGKT